MNLAICEAWKYQLLTYPNPSVGAVVTLNKKVLSVQAHKKSGGPHAEILALKEAYLYFYPNSRIKNLYDSFEIHNFLQENHKNIFSDCEIYITLEPCSHLGKTPSCATLIKNLNLKQVNIGSKDSNNIASGGEYIIKNNSTKVKIGICKKQCDDLLIPFLKWNKKQFIFFKLAMREDGSIDGGYITTKESLIKVHKIRTLIDRLVIGGCTVRTDRPKLDTRFLCNEFKNPNILIYTRNKKIDKSIGLFNVNNRKVDISSSLKIIDHDRFVMIEGGFNLLELLKDKIDMLMLFTSENTNNDKKFDIESLGFTTIYKDQSTQNPIYWNILTPNMI